MKFTIDKNHRDFFKQNNFVEFEGLIPQSQLDAVCPAIESALAKRLGVKEQALERQLPFKVFSEANDLWRDDPVLRKLSTNPVISQVASELVTKKPLRLGFDQLFSGLNSAMLLWKEQGIFSFLLSKSFSLQELCCFQGIECGLMICLKKGLGDVDPESETSVFSPTPGNAVFFSSYLPVDYNALIQREGYQYLMIVYVNSNTVVIHKENDIHGNSLRKLGYMYGDKLKDNLNPVILR